MGTTPIAMNINEEEGQQSPITTYGQIDINSIPMGMQVDPRVFDMYGAAPASGQDDYILGGGGGAAGRTFGDKMNYSLGLSYVTGNTPSLYPRILTSLRRRFRHGDVWC